MSRLPTFFNYKEEGSTDSGNEAIQDFFLSWTLRCAKEDVKEDNFLINYYSKRILFLLLYGMNTDIGFKVDYSKFDSFSVLEIKTKRQFKGIDLLADIKVQFDNCIQDFILNVENKWYSLIRVNQLKDYTEIIRTHPVFDNKIIVSVVIFCDYVGIKREGQIELCNESGYSYTNIEELAESMTLEPGNNLGTTGNYLFDTYWFGESASTLQ